MTSSAPCPVLSCHGEIYLQLPCLQAAQQPAPGSYITASDGILYGVDGQPVVLQVLHGLYIEPAIALKETQHACTAACTAPAGRASRPAGGRLAYWLSCGGPPGLDAGRHMIMRQASTSSQSCLHTLNQSVHEPMAASAARLQ